MAAASSTRPHRRKDRIPPGPAARAAAAQLRNQLTSGTQPATNTTDSTVIDLSAYERAAQQRTVK
jgi:hypothetical protein